MINLGKLNNGKEILLEEKENGCIECISHCKDKDGYTRIKYNGKHERLHRIIYMLKYGEIPKKMVIRHKCDNPSCCNINHLEIGTPKDNVRDMIERGRDKYHTKKPNILGEKNKAHKLKEQQVIEIYLSKLSNKELSKIYKVSEANISYIKNKKQWFWLTDKLDKKN